MNQPIDWNAIAAPLDFTRLRSSTSYLQRWIDYEQTACGVLFHCATAAGQWVDFRLDVVEADVVRVRMNPFGFRNTPSDMLIEPRGETPSFRVSENALGLTLTTERMRLEFQKFPWQLRAYAANSQAPFFSQRVDDRAYGPTFEVTPIGFEQEVKGRATVHEAVTILPGEAFYGFGDKFTPLDKRGQELISWAVDCGNVSSFRSYKNIPFFMSTAGYGLFIHTSFPIVYRMGSESSISYSFHIADSQLDYFLIYGPGFKHILKRYAGLTGLAPAPPKWSFGFWISRCGYQSRAQVEAIIHEMRARGFPCDVVNLDPWWMGDGPWSTFTWDTQRFPDPATMIRDLRAQGVHVCLWVTPYVPAGTPIYAEGVNGGFFVRRADGRISPVVEAFAGRDLAAVDFTNPAGREWFLSKLQPLLDMGVTVFKTDFGEQAPVDAVYYDGRSGLEVHNLYPLLYNRAVYELTERANGRGLVYARSAYAGSQRYPLYFGGDSYSSLDQMMAHLWGLLSYGMSGVPFCSHDVGGFDYPPRAFDEASPEGYPTDPVVYTRWLQFGVFSSHLRAHGKQPREPWACGPQVEAIARRYLRLRYRLLPYLYSEAVKASQTGLPMLRPMVLEFQSDTNTRGLDLQYMLGESFLVAPVVDPLGRCHVYLPAGEWVDFWSKDVLSGARWIDSEAPLETLPVWVRGGSVVPLGPEMDYVDEKPLDPLTLEIYAPRGSVSYTLHDEDRPDIAMRYEVRQSELAVEVGPAPGRVEITLCGVRAASAGLPGQPLTILDRPGGQCVGFDGRAGHRVIFELEGRDAD